MRIGSGGRRTEDVLGETLTIRQAVLTIVGVAAPGFVGETNGQQPDTWIPLRMQPSVIPGNNWLREAPPDKSMWLHLFARLAPGVTAAQAEAQANRVLKSNLESFYGAAAREAAGRSSSINVCRFGPAVAAPPHSAGNSRLP